MNKKSKILHIIYLIRESHPMMVDIYTQGSCLNFHLLLRAIFPEAKPYDNVDHVISKIDDTYYDINGIVRDHHKYTPYDGRGFSQMMKAYYKPRLFDLQKNTPVG